MKTLATLIISLLTGNICTLFTNYLRTLIKNLSIHKIIQKLQILLDIQQIIGRIRIILFFFLRTSEIKRETLCWYTPAW